MKNKHSKPRSKNDGTEFDDRHIENEAEMASCFDFFENLWYEMISIAATSLSIAINESCSGRRDDGGRQANPSRRDRKAPKKTIWRH
jgi:hypothetical protein